LPAGREFVAANGYRPISDVIGGYFRDSPQRKHSFGSHRGRCAHDGVMMSNAKSNWLSVAGAHSERTSSMSADGGDALLGFRFSSALGLHGKREDSQQHCLTTANPCCSLWLVARMKQGVGISPVASLG
jgi:hypothetical protein